MQPRRKWSQVSAKNLWEKSGVKSEEGEKTIGGKTWKNFGFNNERDEMFALKSGSNESVKRRCSAAQIRAPAFERVCVFIKTVVRRVNHFLRRCHGSNERRQERGGEIKRENSSWTGGRVGTSETKSEGSINKQQLRVKIPSEMTWKRCTSH